MNAGPPKGTLSRRQLLRMVGLTAGGAAMYQAMSSLGLAAESSFRATPALGAAPRGASVLVLGAGIAGLVSALELRNAGYAVQVLEYNPRPGGRSWTLRGGDRYTELGGETQDCQFDPGLYINPGPWRLPHHHHGILGYCRQLGVPLENFVQVNYNAYLHSHKAFGGKPQRLRTVKADFHGHVAELLARHAQGGRLDAPVSTEDQERLLYAMRSWGALDEHYKYARSYASAERRGFDKQPGGGVAGKPDFSTPVGLHDVLGAGLWEQLLRGEFYEMQSSLLQPVGGMDAIPRAFARELGPLVRYGCKVTGIGQDERGVTASFEDSSLPGTTQTASADYCICTIPLSVLAQIPMAVGQPMTDAIAGVAYVGSVKVGLQFKRRFWEQDEHIYGGITYTDLPIDTISYPASGYHDGGKGVLLGGYIWGTDAARFTSMTPARRVRETVAHGARIHPQYPAEFDNGIAVAWHRVPSAMGCFALWSDAAREQHFANLCAFDGRIVLAGEHASWLPAWQEGAVTSAIDAVTRLHQRALAQAASA